MSTTPSTPGAFGAVACVPAGLAMLAEWRPHECCWMAWPCRVALWGERLGAARRAFAEVAKAIAALEPVTMMANPGDVAEASLMCGAGAAILALAIAGV